MKFARKNVIKDFSTLLILSSHFSFLSFLLGWQSFNANKLLTFNRALFFPLSLVSDFFVKFVFQSQYKKSEREKQVGEGEEQRERERGWVCFHHFHFSSWCSSFQEWIKRERESLKNFLLFLVCFPPCCKLDLER